MFVSKIGYNKENVDNNQYPYNLPFLNGLNELFLTKPVTFLVGENGSGKSTLIEAIAINCNLNPEGGSQNYCFTTRNTHSILYKNLQVIKTVNHPKTKYFLRAESFYNTCSYIDENSDALDAVGSKPLHDVSHGESFIKLVQNRFYDHGLYILDEPEAALSPSRQMSLLCMIDDLVKKGSQFIIATHSPILLAYPDATIYDLDNGLKETKYSDTNHFRLYKTFIENSELMINRLLKY